MAGIVKISAIFYFIAYRGSRTYKWIPLGRVPAKIIAPYALRIFLDDLH